MTKFYKGYYLLLGPNTQAKSYQLKNLVINY